MNKKSLWALAATRPLVLTMGPLVLTMVFCCIGMFTSCSKDDDNPVDSTIPLETIPLGATLSCLQTDGDSIQMENKGDGLFETAFIEVKDASNLNATVSIRYQVPGGFEKNITKDFVITHDDCPARVGDKIRYILDAYYLDPKLTAEIFDTYPTEERIIGRWKDVVAIESYHHIWTFNADHTFSMDNYTGTWSLNGNILNAYAEHGRETKTIDNTDVSMLTDDKMYLDGYMITYDGEVGGGSPFEATLERMQEK